MRRPVLIHLYILVTIATINAAYPAPMTTRIAYAAVRRCLPDGAFATETAPMRRRVLIHLLVFDTTAAINVVYPTPMTTQITYPAVRRHLPTVHLQLLPR